MSGPYGNQVKTAISLGPGSEFSSRYAPGVAVLIGLWGYKWSVVQQVAIKVKVAI